jgi:hypothetical protein
VFNHLTFGQKWPLNPTMQWKLTRLVLAQRFPGWTLDYIDSLSYADRASVLHILQAQETHKAMGK